MDNGSTAGAKGADAGKAARTAAPWKPKAGPRAGHRGGHGGSPRDWLRSHRKQAGIALAAGILLLITADVTKWQLDMPEEVPYMEFARAMEDGDVDTVYYEPSEEDMRYTLLNDETRAMTAEERKGYSYGADSWRMTRYPGGEDFRKGLLEKNINIVIRSGLPLSMTVLPRMGGGMLFLAYFVFLFAYIRQGRGLKKDEVMQTTDVRFSDVIGHDEIIDDLRFVVRLMRDPSAGARLGASTPKGMLFSGEPGTGKTLIAKAIAGEAGVPFLYMNSSGFIELYVGTGAARVRKLFQMARRHAPCIVFLDEIDAVGRRRGSWGSHSEDQQTIDALLQEMDGFGPSEGIFVIAATNSPESLDPALTRSGRFDRQVVISPPKDWETRGSLFAKYLGGAALEEGLDLSRFARQTTGFTGADIKAVCNEARIIASMRGAGEVSAADMEEAIDKKVFKGNRSRRARAGRDAEVVAYHEAGHAAAAYLLGLPVARVSIIGTTSGVGGYVMQGDSGRQLMTRGDIEKQAIVAYAGRASEEIKFGDASTGAASDISQATGLIRGYVMKYGFHDGFGLLDMDMLSQGGMVKAEDAIACMGSLSRDLMRRAGDLLRGSYGMVEALASELIEKETLSGEEAAAALASAQGGGAGALPGGGPWRT